MGAIVLFFMIFEIIDKKRIIWVEIIDVFIINITYSFDFNKKEYKLERLTTLQRNID